MYGFRHAARLGGLIATALVISASRGWWGRWRCGEHSGRSRIGPDPPAPCPRPGMAHRSSRGLRRRPQRPARPGRFPRPCLRSGSATRSSFRSANKPSWATFRPRTVALAVSPSRHRDLPRHASSRRRRHRDGSTGTITVRGVEPPGSARGHLTWLPPRRRRLADRRPRRYPDPLGPGPGQRAGRDPACRPGVAVRGRSLASGTCSAFTVAATMPVRVESRSGTSRRRRSSSDDHTRSRWPPGHPPSVLIPGHCRALDRLRELAPNSCVSGFIANDTGIGPGERGVQSGASPNY